MERDIQYIFIGINIVVGVLFYLRTKCEIPLFLSLFNAMVEYRVFSLEYGLAEFIQFNYKIEFSFNMELAYYISWMIFLGTCIMQYTFIFFYKENSVVQTDSNETFKQFILQKKQYIFIGLGVTTAFQFLISGEDTGSYGFMIRLANSSFILFFYLLFTYTKVEKLGVKVLYLLTFLFFGWLTYSSSLRFQFLGWMIPIGYFMVRSLAPQRKLLMAIPGSILIILIFSMAGSLRYANAAELTTESLYDDSVERLVVSDDINFIDGFMMMYQVYPRLLDHTYGVEHLNILFRPIPRSIWPGKPLAGWFQNYREKYKVEFANIGFSPTIWGVFYAEGGIDGIVLFSIAWGFFLVYIYKKARLYASELSDLLTGILLASMIPIFRSGDMAGDFAIVLMSYWPIIVLIVWYNRELKKDVE